jgi:hypothetical protein
MRTFTKREMKSLLEEVGAAITNSKDNPLVLEKVQEFGYIAETFTAAEELRKEAERLYLEKGPKAGQKISLSIQLRNKIEEIHQLFMIYEKMVRRDLKDDPALFSKFDLDGPRDYSISGKIKESKGFYKNCLDNEKVGEFVIRYGLTSEKLQAHLDEIEEIEKDTTVRALLVSDAEKTTEDRNKVFQQLNNWWQNYKMVLKYVYRDDPQQLEAFRLKGYSLGYKPAGSGGSGSEEPQDAQPVEEEPGTSPAEESQVQT